MLYHTAENNHVFFKQVEPFVEVMIKYDPVDDAGSYSDYALPEAAVKHEPLDEGLPHSDCTLYVSIVKHEAEDITAV
jgi:hypothetical protein